MEQRLRNGCLTLKEAARFVTQVGSALETAHRLGVVHRDVRPANVFLDDDGNYFLGDFGIASDISTRLAASLAPSTPDASTGSPAYASPEQLRHELVGPQTDVYALGFALFECLTGSRPFGDARTYEELIRRQLHDPVPAVHSIRSDVPSSVDDVIDRATSKVASDRHGSAVEFVDSLSRALAGVDASVERETGPLRNPFKGLRAFHEADAADFFGRERLVQRLVDALRPDDRGRGGGRLIAVVGPSGSGKSSVVLAGLVPAVRSGAIDGSEEWLVTSMLPGPHPFEELEVALDRLAVDTAPLDLAALHAPRGITRAIKRLLARDDADLLLVIDQFEELFMLCDDVDERRAFIDRLVEAVKEPTSRLRVVLTLRADFYDRPLRHPDLAQLLERGTITVGALTTDELETAITRPVERVGASFEPGLVTQIVAEVVHQPSSLPLLQYALTELFERNTDGRLTIDSYGVFGGLGGAITSRAEALILGGPDDTTERRLFTRLVNLGEGSEDTRRRALRGELLQLGNNTDDGYVGALIERFGDARLLSFDRDPSTREPTVELAHEALIRQWPRLRDWVEEDRDGLRLLRHLGATSVAWRTSGREEGELYRGGRLELAERYAAEHPTDLNNDESAFLAASLARARAEARSKQRGERRVRRGLVAVASLAIVSLIAGSLAWQSRQRATASATHAETGRLAASAPALAQTSLSLGLLAAAESFRRERTPETLGALQRTLTAQDRILGFLGPGRSYFNVAVEGDLVFALRRGAIDRWKLSTLEPQGTTPIPDRSLVDPVLGGYRLRFSVGGGVAAVRFGDASSVLVDVTSGVVRDLPKSIRTVVSPSGSRTLVIHPNQSAELLETKSLERVWLTDVPSDQIFADQMKSVDGPPPFAAPMTPLLTDAAFLSNGDPVISRTYRLLHLDRLNGHTVAEFARRFASPQLTVGSTTGGPVGSTLGGLGAATWIAIDGNRVVGASIATAAEWNSNDLSLITQSFTWRGNPFATSQTTGMAPVRAGRVLVGRADGSVAEIDTTTGEIVGSLVDTQIGAVQGVATNADRTRAVAAGEQGLAVISLNGDRLLARAVASRGSISVGGARSPDGTRLFIDGPAQRANSHLRWSRHSALRIRRRRAG